MSPLLCGIFNGCALEVVGVAFVAFVIAAIALGPGWMGMP